MELGFFPWNCDDFKNILHGSEFAASNYTAIQEGKQQ